MRSHVTTPVVGTLAAAAVVLSGCAIPADSVGTLDRARDGNLVVGVSEHPPWTDVDENTGEVSGSEADLVESFAESINADVEWSVGAESIVAERVKAGEVDLMIGGLTTASPWSSHMALTRAYTTVTADDGSSENMVMGVRLGENDLLTSLERHLAEVHGEI